MNVTRRDRRPGETIFGGGAGVLFIGRRYQGRQPTLSENTPVQATDDRTEEGRPEPVDIARMVDERFQAEQRRERDADLQQKK
jgi:hypothetical protein